jgi:hypothetical protein
MGLNLLEGALNDQAPSSLRIAAQATSQAAKSRQDVEAIVIYTDPDCEVTIDLKNPPAKPGYHGTYYLGPCGVKEDVWSKQSADHSHRFWHGYENPIASVARGKVRQGGNVMAMLKLLPVIKPAFKMFPIALEEMGHGDLVVRKK